MFIRAGRKADVAEYINNKYTLVVVDEAHGASAPAYIKFISQLNCKYRLGLTATPARKDSRDILTHHFIGPIVSESNVISLVPKIELWETGIVSKNKYSMWVYAMKFLAKNKERNVSIVKEVFKDLRAGHAGIIIPVDSVDQCRELTDMINSQAEYNNEKRKENWPKETAIIFSRQVIGKNEAKRKKIFQDFDQGKHKVLVAIRSMIKQGIDLDTPTMVYITVPMSASANSGITTDGKPIGAPMFYQLANRVATFVEGKKQPIIKIMIDGLGQSSGCFRSLFWKEIWPKLKSDYSNDNTVKYKMDKADIDRAIQIAKARDYIPLHSPKERFTSAQLLGNLNNVKSEKVVKGKGFSATKKV